MVKSMLQNSPLKRQGNWGTVFTYQLLKIIIRESRWEAYIDFCHSSSLLPEKQSPQAQKHRQLAVGSHQAHTEGSEGNAQHLGVEERKQCPYRTVMILKTKRSDPTHPKNKNLSKLNWEPAGLSPGEAYQSTWTCCSESSPLPPQTALKWGRC